MEQALFTALLHKYIGNECSPEEVDQLMDLMEQNDFQAEREAFIQAQLSGTAEPFADPLLQERLEKRLAQIITYIGHSPAPRLRWMQRTWTRVAAAAIIVLLLGGGAWWFSRPAPPAPVAVAHTPTQNDILPGRDRAVLTLAGGEHILLDSTANGILAQQGGVSIHKNGGQLVYDAARAPRSTTHTLVYNTMTTPRGGQYQLTLPDGTNVWLNAASSIRYPTTFAAGKREVFITGEAYFEVKTLYAAPNEKIPFTVTVTRASGPGETVQVLGTHFNINAYDDEPLIATTLLEGSVSISRPATLSLPKGGTEPVEVRPTILSPGQQAQLAAAGEPVKVTDKADIEQVMAWKNHLFKFDNVDLKKVMRQLSRWYDVDVSYENNAPVSEVFYGEMQRSLNLSQVLNGLGGMGVHFRIEGRRLLVTP